MLTVLQRREKVLKILVLADKESKALWDYYEPGKLDEYDLILSCGDLSPHYLSFLATFTKAPVLYVHGNHDDCYEQTPPEGCECIDDRIYEYRGVRIIGLGGSLRYKPGIHQYTQEEMCDRARRLRFKIWRKKGFDILLTHAPARALGDAKDLPHQGFEAFRKLIEKYHPAFFVHGHVHQNYSHKFVREQEFLGTTIVNAYERYVIEIPDR